MKSAISFRLSHLNLKGIALKFFYIAETCRKIRGIYIYYIKITNDLH